MDFLILGYPRSATTWLANLFTTDRSFCLHDPIATMTLEEIDSFRSPGRLVGAACTGLWMLPGWVDTQPCPKVVIVRDKVECDASLVSIGMTAIPESIYSRLFEFDAHRMLFHKLWDEEYMALVWAYLLPEVPFDRERYRMLRTFSIQPQFEETAVDPKKMNAFFHKIVGG